jgi:hypothetical protein
MPDPLITKKTVLKFMMDHRAKKNSEELPTLKAEDVADQMLRQPVKPTHYLRVKSLLESLKNKKFLLTITDKTDPANPVTLYYYNKDMEPVLV